MRSIAWSLIHEARYAQAVNNAISFVLYNEAIYQFIQWFTTEPEIDLQVMPDRLAVTVICQ